MYLLIQTIILININFLVVHYQCADMNAKIGSIAIHSEVVGFFYVFL